jgi:hypothetical protein
MVTASRSERGVRYRLLETLRQYGEERLDDRGETAALRDAHLTHYVAHSGELRRQWYSPDQVIAAERFDDDWENLAAAHQWSLTTAATAASFDLVRNTETFAVRRLRRDHQEWTQRTRALAEATGTVPTRIASAVALWAFTDGDGDTAIAAAASGLDDADQVNVASCYQTLALQLHNWGRHDEARSALPRLRTLLTEATSPEVRLPLAFAICQAGVVIASRGNERDLHQLFEIARPLGPDGAAQALTMRAMHRLAVGRDADGALADLREAIRLIESFGASAVWAEIAVCHTLALGDRGDARSELHRVIGRSYEERQWNAILALLDAAPLVLASANPRAAAAIYGFVEGREPPFGNRTRRLAVPLIESTPDFDGLKAAGADMDGHQIVALTLAALAEA